MADRVADRVTVLGGHSLRPRAFDNPEGAPRLRQNGKEITGKHVNTLSDLQTRVLQMILAPGPAVPKATTGRTFALRLRGKGDSSLNFVYEVTSVFFVEKLLLKDKYPRGGVA